MNLGSAPPVQSPALTSSIPAESTPSPVLSSTLLLMAGLCLGALVRSLGPGFLRTCFLPIPILEINGLLALLAGLLAAVVLHEAGHLLAALFNDFEVSGVVIGPFRLLRFGTSWTLMVKSQSLFGAAVSAFPKTEENWRQRMLAVVAAGPVATLLTGLASVLLLYVSEGGGDSWFIWFLRAFAQVSFLIFVLGLVPNHKSLLAQNDAALLRSLWCNDPQADEIFLYHLVLQQQRMGVRPRNYPLNLIHLLTRFRGRPDFMAFFATTMASWAFDNNNADAANGWDQQALTLYSRCSSHSRHLVMVNSACFDMTYRNDLPAARAKLDKLDLNKIVSPYLRYRARAISHLLAKRVPEALADIAAARFALPKRLRDSGVEYLLLSHLHAVTLSMQPDNPLTKIQNPKTSQSRQTSLAVI